MRRICSAELLPGHRVKLAYDEGGEAIVDLTALIGQGGVFAPLADPAYFEQVRVSEDGRFISWPGDLDFCADALWEQAARAEPAGSTA